MSTWGEIAEMDDFEGCQPYRAHTPPLEQGDVEAAFKDTRAQPVPTYHYDLSAFEDGEIVEKAPVAVRTYGSLLGPGPVAAAAPVTYRYPYEHKKRGNRDQDRCRDWDHHADRRAPPPPLPRRRSWLAFIFIRTRTRGPDVWYEYLMELHRGQYSFLQVDSRGDRAPVQELLQQALSVASRRGLLFLPKDIEQAERCYESTTVGEGVPHRTYLIPMDTTQRPNPTRLLTAPPAMYWITESELAMHEQMGPPSAFGRPICPRSIKAHAALPLNLRFASAAPPIVIYHGTDAAAAAAIAASTFMPSAKPGMMLGAGLYFAGWDKASQFAEEDADRKPRPTPGKVLRCLLAGSTACTTMTGSMVCKCGCGRAFVDHTGEHGASTKVTFVPDNSLPATRRAEWCVRDPGCVFVDGMFQFKHPAM
jgi:hypothetical protein